MSAPAERTDSTLRGLIRLRDGKLVPRRQGWLEPGDLVLRCPFGHHVHLPLHFHKGAITVDCTSRPDAGHAACGCLLYVATGEMGLFFADVTEEEAAEINRQKIPPTAVARFLRF